MFFCLKPYIYAANCDNGIVILDVKKDKYFSLTDEAASSFTLIVNKEFTDQGSTYIPLDQKVALPQEKLNYWINYFLTQDFIQTSSKKGHFKDLSIALKPGGLVDYRWIAQPTISFTSRTSIFLIFQFIILLLRVNFTLKTKGINGILMKINKYKYLHATYKEPLAKEIQELAATLDIACSLYPKKMYCLAWASTLVLMALKKGWRCNLFIGVQSPPFYAHAWAESNNNVINDDPQVKTNLSILLKEPFA